jgi:hypothetical protein
MCQVNCCAVVRMGSFGDCHNSFHLSVGANFRMNLSRPFTFIDSFALAELSVNSVWISRDNMRFRRRECFLEDFDGSTMYRYFGSCISIVVPSSVLGKMCFCECRSRSDLKSIVISSSVVVLATKSVRECESLESVTFETGSRLESIEKSVFHGSGLRSVLIPSSVVVVGQELSVSACHSNQ